MLANRDKDDDMTDSNVPESLRLAIYRFSLSPLEPMELPPYKGAVLRGGFGATFKRLVCIQRNPNACTPCKLGNVCPYGYIFETSPPEGSQVLRTLSDVPAPFVLEPPLDGRTRYEPGESLDFDLVLVGRGIQYLPYFLVVFQELGQAGLGRRRARYQVERVAAIDPLTDEETTIYAGGGDLVAGQGPSLSSPGLAGRAATLPTDRLTLRFLTPTRVKYQDRYTAQPDFHVIIRSLLRRISSLVYFHCGQLWETDFRSIITAAEAVETAEMAVEWIDWERYSGRQKRRMNLGGFVGEMTYQGDLAGFRSLLVLGELVHVGKATVFGNGKYEAHG